MYYLFGASFCTKTWLSKGNGLKHWFQTVAGFKNRWFLSYLCPTRASCRLRLQLNFVSGNVTDPTIRHNGKKNAPPQCSSASNQSLVN